MGSARTVARDQERFSVPSVVLQHCPPCVLLDLLSQFSVSLEGELSHMPHDGFLGPPWYIPCILIPKCLTSLSLE